MSDRNRTHRRIHPLAAAGIGVAATVPLWRRDLIARCGDWLLIHGVTPPWRRSCPVPSPGQTR